MNFEPEPILPDGVDPEKIESLVSDVIDRLAKVGLYADHEVRVDVQSGEIGLYMAFEIGDLAFAKRVQNPEQAQVDDSFHQFEADAVRERFQEIKDKFSGKPDKPGT